MSDTHPILAALLPAPQPVTVDMLEHVDGGYCLRIYTGFGVPVDIGHYATPEDIRRVARLNGWRVNDLTQPQIATP